MEDKKKLYQYLLLLGDNALILGHRLSELCGHGPNLETDIALTNISLDLFGEVRNLYQYAAKIEGRDATEDSIAFLRIENEYRNTILVEQGNVDFAYVIVRQFLFDVYHHLLLDKLQESKDTQIAAISTKSIKESRYHLRFSTEWMKRLGGGTEESHRRLQEAVDHLYPYINELLVPTDLEKEMAEVGIGADLKSLEKPYHETVNAVLTVSNMSIENLQQRYAQGKKGRHTEQMGFILSDIQFMQRTYPNMQW
jgi:ring-1,2-phenylacetyl-CoA epoxidase subunit PaaC